MPLKVFISYNHQDGAEARRLQSVLEAAGIEVVIDDTSMQAGEPIEGFIHRSIREADATIPLISKNSLGSPWVAVEISRAFGAEEFSSKRFIPCRLDDSFFEHTFVGEKTDAIDRRIEEIAAETESLREKNQRTGHLDRQRDRLGELRNDLPVIVERLLSGLTVDLAGEAFDRGVARLIAAIKGRKQFDAPDPPLRGTAKPDATSYGWLLAVAAVGALAAVLYWIITGSPSIGGQEPGDQPCPVYVDERDIPLYDERVANPPPVLVRTDRELENDDKVRLEVEVVNIAEKPVFIRNVWWSLLEDEWGSGQHWRLEPKPAGTQLLRAGGEEALPPGASRVFRTCPEDSEQYQRLVGDAVGGAWVWVESHEGRIYEENIRDQQIEGRSGRAFRAAPADRLGVLRERAIKVVFEKVRIVDASETNDSPAEVWFEFEVGEEYRRWPPSEFVQIQEGHIEEIGLEVTVTGIEGAFLLVSATGTEEDRENEPDPMGDIRREYPIAAGQEFLEVLTSSSPPGGGRFELWYKIEVE